MIDMLAKTKDSAPPISTPNISSDVMLTSNNPIPKEASVGGTTGVNNAVKSNVNVALAKLGMLLELNTGIDMINPSTRARTNPAVNKIVIS